MNLTHTLPGGVAANLTAGDDLGLLPYAYGFATTLAVADEAALAVYDASKDRLALLQDRVDPYVQARHAVAYKSARVALARPLAGHLRHACVYEFKSNVTEARLLDVLHDWEDVLSATPGLAHFSFGLDILEVEESQPQQAGLGLVADFVSSEDFDKFFAHKSRLQMMRELNPLLRFRTCVDYVVPNATVEAVDVSMRVPVSQSAMAYDSEGSLGWERRHRRKLRH